MSKRQFQISKSTLIIDRLMTHFIKVGGIGVIVAVMGIFLFILWQVIPLFQGAKVAESRSVELPVEDYHILGLDEYAELPFLVDATGNVTFVDLVGERGVFSVNADFATGKEFSAFDYLQESQEVAFGTTDGQFSVVQIEYGMEFQDDQRVLQPSLSPGRFMSVGKAGFPIRKIRYADGGQRKLLVAIQEVENRTELHAVTLEQQRSLFGAGEITIGDAFDLTSLVQGKPEFVEIGDRAESICVGTIEGSVFYLTMNQGKFEMRQRLRPFVGFPSTGIASMDFLLGDVSLVITNPDGVNRVFSLFVSEDTGDRRFGLTKEFPALGSGATVFSKSQRNKAFLIGTDTHLSLRYATTESVRWLQRLDFSPKLARISSKYDELIVVDDDHRLHTLALNDPHPESSFKALFGKVWYEGFSEPSYEWQSTGGTDDFEPKLSMVPLIYGTLKGTFYALLFAVPIALLAAIYTSQFAHPKFKAFVKPVMEIMATLPSVVLGFLAALWLAPIIEDRVPSLLIMIILIPSASLLLGWGLASLPVQYRAMIKPGHEFVFFVPMFLLLVYASWISGPVLERMLFVVTDPATGVRTADFRLWWPKFTGVDFQQRNSVVIGFAMGFAVIPIIFTITEDSLSNVPRALISGSLALGASRWQTAIRVVLPTASAGIFSALMIGLGRAVGETMIMVMATGNTPIMDMNIFNGMRTLAANIAVELPEAPHHGTLYRTLFLGGLILFMMTFFLNTVAEVLRQRLRERFKTV